MKSFLAIWVGGLVMALVAGCSDRQAKPVTPVSKTESNSNNGSLLTAPVDYISASVQAQKHAEKVIDVSYINQAIQMFNVQEGRLPKTLAELVPNYIAKIPEAPFGSKIVYDAAAGTVKVVKQ